MTPEVKNIIVQKRHSCHVQVILIEKQCDLRVAMKEQIIWLTGWWRKAGKVFGYQIR